MRVVVVSWYNQFGLGFTQIMMWHIFARFNVGFFSLSSGDLLAHKNSVNSVATNSTCIFTGSRLV